MIIEESKDLCEIKLEELQASLEKFELSLKQINSHKVEKKALQESFSRK